jgi:hypothetical protein
MLLQAHCRISAVGDGDRNTTDDDCDRIDDVILSARKLESSWPFLIIF